MSGSLPPDISVVVATRGRPEIVGEALSSLAAQTLPADAFEVVVVVNGSSDGTYEAVEEVARQQTDMHVRVLRSERPGVAHARTVGLWAARGTHMTIVDDDDRVTPHYLEDLLAAVEPGIVPLAWLADVEPDAPDAPDFANYYSDALTAALAIPGAAEGAPVPVVRLPQAISLNVGKLVPVSLARTVGYDFSLRGGSDFVFWTKAFAHEQFSFRVLPDRRACYLRTKVPDSLSRQEPGYDFSITQRLACIGSLESIPDSTGDVERLTRHMVRSQLVHAQRFLGRNPDQRTTVIEDVESRRLRRMFWSTVNEGAAQNLALLYCFTPWVGTAGIVAARRLRERGVLVDVVCKDLDEMRDRDTSLKVIADPWVARVAALGGPADFSSWGSVESWSGGVFAQLEEWGTDHRSVYSRAMWVASHLVAAQYKLRNPSVPWTAEFSDPISRTIHGRRRPGRAREGALLEELRSGMRAAGFEPPGHHDTFEWAEVAAYALADEVLFTNENQLEYMLDYCPDPALAERVRAVATVRPHPTLPPRFYDLAEPDYVLDEGVVNLGYFGAFYPTRGLTEVTGALEGLPAHVRSRVRLHVFTQDPATIRSAVVDAGLADCVVVNPYVGFLEFLALTRRFDVLVVNDADSSEHGPGGNPYLPSKLSDYLGSGTPVWAIVEPGSVMSRRSLAHTTLLGDVAAAAEVVTGLVAARAAGPVGASADL
ncbi:glycosyltransferase [Nocardioides sp. Arc9.136]|uniref:glycosyltransferase n=1 Tax=Nocardioides sp. Arc9.136 TaxID=2996826 RepID=UPI0026650337|nr:glycosyltransferase [Nocardioides sp. Arc9.136]WKN49397.1 glycosyltransferase [Nocardioides sp. Arc9.136]